MGSTSNPTAGEIAEKPVVEGLVNGTLSAAANGGSGRAFASGFLGAFAAAELGGRIMPGDESFEAVVARTAVAAVVGGTVAEIGGGDFANGAISAAFQQLFNEGLHAKTRQSRIPAKVIILQSRTKNKGSYSLFYYQLENANGMKLTGNGYAVEEHLYFAKPGPGNSEGQFIHIRHGVIHDEVGFALRKNGILHSRTYPKSVNKAVVLYQTFSVKYDGTIYNLQTIFEHDMQVVNGSPINTVTDIVP